MPSNAASESKDKGRRKRTQAERDRSTVFAYPYFHDLKSCIESGWQLPKVRSYLLELYGDDPAPPALRAMERWRRKHVPAAKVLPHKFITERLQGVDYQVDVLKHLSRLVPLLEERLGRGLEQEVNSFGGLPLPVVDQVAKTYLEALRDWVKVAQDLGIMKAPPAPVFDMRTQNWIGDPAVMTELLRVAKEIKQLGQAPDVSVSSGSVNNGRPE